MALVDRVLNTFGASEPDTPPPGGMTFEQRAALIGALYELRDRRGRLLTEWIPELRRVLTYSDATKVLGEALPDLNNRSNLTDQEIDSKVTDIARVGIRIAEMHPVAAFGGDVRHLLTQSVEGALIKSRPVRLLRLLLPTLCILFSGGLLWGAYQVDGIKNAARAARTDIDKALTEITKETTAVTTAATTAEANVQTTASAASIQIGNLTTGLLAGWNERVRNESQAQLQELTASVQKAKDAAQPKVQAELDGIVQWGKDKRSDVQKAVDAEKDSLNALTPAIETAKAQVTPQIQAQLTGITQWGGTKRDDLTTAATVMSNVIAAVGQTVDKLKSDAAIKTQAAVGDISEWARGQKAVAGTAIDGQKTIALKDVDAQKTAVMKDMDDRRLDVQGLQTSVRTQLALIVNDVRSGEDDIQKRLLETQNRQRDLDAKLASLQTLVDQSVRLQTVIERADSKGTLTFSTLVSALEMKDGIAAGAIFVSLLAIVMSGLALLRRP
jgi:hypothetical protein